MLSRLVVISAALLASSLVAAQTEPTSRLDAAIAGGKIKVCSPGDYKPFSFQRPDGGFEGLDIDLIQAAANCELAAISIRSGASDARMKMLRLALTKSMQKQF